jgi:hypothetical protein
MTVTELGPSVTRVSLEKKTRQLSTFGLLPSVFPKLAQIVVCHYGDKIHRPTKLFKCLRQTSIFEYNATNTQTIYIIYEMLILFNVSYSITSLLSSYLNYLWRYKHSNWTGNVYADILTIQISIFQHFIYPFLRLMMVLIWFFILSTPSRHNAGDTRFYSFSTRNYNTSMSVSIVNF